MIVSSSHNQPRPSNNLLEYLSNHLNLSDSAIKLGLKQSELEQAPLPIVLWNLGLISVKQYDSLIQWQKESKVYSVN